MEDFVSKWAGLSYANLSLTEWSLFALSTLALATILVYVRGLLLRKITAFAQHTSTRADDMLVRCLHRTSRFFLFFLALVILAHAFHLPSAALATLDKIGLIVLFVQLASWGKVLITYGLEVYFARRNGSLAALGSGSSYLATYGAINVTAQFLLFTLLLLLLLDNLGVNITALVTGLGIGGIAIALAVQNIIGDIFASLTIILDKPFEAGDFIIVGSMQGTVESVGLKTTRIRSLSGEQWVYPNKQLIESGVQNYKRMNERRIQFGFGLKYETPIDQLEAVPDLVREIIKQQPKTRFDRAHFKSYGESSLDFEVVYYILSPNYNDYMDTQQAINIELLRALSSRKVEMAYPTRQLLISGDTLSAAAANEGKVFAPAAHR